ncbi:MAG TPA: hypothetical protein VFP59_14145 [Candidatus Angelobacter sp.]|nr:hypothetical protein [Candidatus Angelobacter sp.]
MTGQQTTKIFRVAAVVALLLVAGLGTSMSAQTSSLNPVPWPTPQVIPPPLIQEPAYQTRPAGVLLAGQIQYASLDSTPGLCNKDDNPTPTPDNPPKPDNCKSTGGWIEVNDELIRVPAGTVVVFPNTFLTWEEVFEMNPNTHQTDPVYQSGLAMADTVRFPGTYQATIDMNIVNGQRIAGIVRIAQDAADMFSGFIEGIDYGNATLIVNGQRVQINDPQITITVPNPDGTPALDPTTGAPITLVKGRYSIGLTPLSAGLSSRTDPDPRFTVDQGNPTVAAGTGYPMCIPVVPPATYDVNNNPYGVALAGVQDPYVMTAPAGFTYTGYDDPQCPEINRKRDPFGGGIFTRFTMNAPGDPQTADNPYPQDPYTEMPFEVGDWVDVIGTQEDNPLTGQPYMTATEAVGNVGVFTAEGVDPAYLVVEVTIEGTASLPDPNFPQEAGVRTRVEGMTTDWTRPVDVSPIDYDCNGNLTFREPAWVTNFPVEPGPPNIGKRGRWRARFPQGGNFQPPTQNIGARVSGGVLGKNKSGLDTDEYQLPTGLYVYPELLDPGNPPVALNFDDFPFLTNGSGPLPLLGSVFDSIQVQLGLAGNPFYPNQNLTEVNPFPYDTTPPITCFAGTASSVARATFSSNPNPPFAGVAVTLDGTLSIPASGPFQWSQIINPGDPTVTIQNANSAKATFIAPTVAGTQNLTFQLVVGGNGTVPASAPATVIVPIAVPPSGTAPVATLTSSANGPVAGGTVVKLTASGVDPAGGTLTFTFGAPAGIALSTQTVNPDGSVSVTFTAPPVPALTAPLQLAFSVTAKSSVSPFLVSAAATTTVAVTNPGADIIQIVNATYRTKKARLDITATDFTPGVTLTVTLDVINQATGQPISLVMGPSIPAAAGFFNVIIGNVPSPNQITITSSGGGILKTGVTVLR